MARDDLDQTLEFAGFRAFLHKEAVCLPTFHPN
jgi:hypothetical protein